MHRIWNGLSQTNLSKDIGTSFQQYQKVERCYNRIYAEQLISICNNRKWDISIFNSDPKETIAEWITRDYPNSDTFPDKYNKIIKSWDVLDANANKNYYGNVKDPDPDHILNMKPIIPKGD